MILARKLDSLSDKSVKLSTWKIILISFTVAMGITFLQQVAFHLWGTLKVDDLRIILSPEHSQEHNIYLSRLPFWGLIYIPTIETLLHQTIIMNIFFILDYEYEYKIGLPVITSAIIFGIAHWGVADVLIDKVIKLIGSTLVGFVLAFNYATFHLSNRKATLYTILIHSLLNLYSATPALMLIKIYDVLKL